MSHRTTCGTTPHLIGSRGGKWAGLTPPPRIQGDLLSCVTITNSTHLTFVSAQFKQVLFLDLGAYILHPARKLLPLWFQLKTICIRPVQDAKLLQSCSFVAVNCCNHVTMLPSNCCNCCPYGPLTESSIWRTWWHYSSFVGGQLSFFFFLFDFLAFCHMNISAS